jgi:Protein of unknown function (DUF2815)
MEASMANVQEPTEFQSLKPWLGSFLNLDKPRTVSKSANEKPKFSANFETDDQSEIDRLKAAIVACARQRWPSLDVGAAIASGRFGVPLSSGDKLAEKAKDKSDREGKSRLRDWSRGKQVLIARSEFLPPVTIVENGQVVVLDDEQAIGRVRNKYFFTGANVLFAVRLNAYEAVGANGLPGVNAYLAAVEGLGTGTPLIARRDPTERFREYRGLAKNEDPTGEADAGSDW